MSHFYARIPRSARRTTPTARAHKSTGAVVEAFGWKGGARIRIDHVNGSDVVTVERIPHPSGGRQSTTQLATFSLWTNGGQS